MPPPLLMIKYQYLYLKEPYFLMVAVSNVQCNYIPCHFMKINVITSFRKGNL
jgi:Zn-finger protein